MKKVIVFHGGSMQTVYYRNNGLVLMTRPGADEGIKGTGTKRLPKEKMSPDGALEQSLNSFLEE
ncbi:MAG TPA: hypothetical protein VHY08_21845 [Bacillota bacterium]|nr:hypothetical protein [Bacillota bacterium]